MAFNVIQHAEQPIPGEHLAEETTPIDKLPDECILVIFGLLSREELIPLTLVSKRFKKLTDKSYRAKWANTHVAIRKWPSLKLELFGESIKSLGLLFMLDEDVMEDICVLCPNIRELYLLGLSAVTFSKLFFHKVLSQLRELHIERLIDIPDTPKFRKDLKAALQCCENLKCLRLAPHSKTKKSNFEMFFKVFYPKLNRFEINVDNSEKNELFGRFLQTNSRLKSLSLKNNRTATDMSPILELQKLEELILISYGEPDLLAPVVSNLYHLSDLPHLELELRYKKDVFETFFKSLRRFQNLREIIIYVLGTDGQRLDIDDHDLMQLKYLPNLTVFKLFTLQNCTNITLPGALRVLKYTPNLSVFRLSGFRQKLDRDERTLMDDGVYEKFRNAYLEKENQSVEIYSTGDSKWYRIGTKNWLDLLKRCLE